MFNQDMIITDGEVDPKDALLALQAMVKRLITSSAMKSIGIHNIVEIPSLEDIDQTDLEDINQLCLNIGQGMQNMKKTLTPEGDDDSGY